MQSNNTVAVRVFGTLAGLLAVAAGVIALSVPLRFYLGTSSELGAALSFLLVVPCAAWLVWSRRRRPVDASAGCPVNLTPVILGTVGAFAWVAYLLWVKEFHGMPTVGGGDSGNHVTILRRFVSTDRKVYEGFVTFHTFAYWLQKLGLTSFEFSSFRALFYCTMLVLTAAVPTFACALLRPSAAPMFAMRVALLLIGWLTIFVAPVYGYQQADGFLAHIFGVVPLLAALAVYVFSPRGVLRLALLGGVIVIYRHTYGLNLGDLLMAVGLLFLWDARSRGRWSLAARSIGVPLILVSFVAYFKINTVVASPGAIVPSNLWLGLSANFFGVVWLVHERMSLTDRDSDLALERAKRFIDFSTAFVAISTLAQAAFWILHPSANYYIYKYGLHSQTLLGLAVCVLLAQKSCRGPWKVWVLPLCLLLALGYTHRKLRRTAIERAFGSAPFTRLSSLLEIETYDVISNTIAGRQSRFQILIDPSWPRFNFTNALFGFVSYEPATVKLGDPGCYFWYEGPEQFRKVQELDAAGIIGTPLVALYSELTRADSKSCSAYPRTLDGEHVHLCHTCL